MEELSKGNLFPKVVEAYSRPTRIVRGKEDELHMEVFFSYFNYCKYIEENYSQILN